MKTRVLIFALGLLLSASLLAQTPFSYRFFNADGTPQTNVITMQAWPPELNTWTIYGTNIV